MSGTPSMSHTPPTANAPIDRKRSLKACRRCHKAKAKCEGPSSWPCRRCKESGIPCVFEGLDMSNALRRSPASPSSASGAWEARFEQLQNEFLALRRTCEEHGQRLDRIDSAPVQTSTSPRTARTSSTLSPIAFGAYEEASREAFTTFWVQCGPLAPGLNLETDTFEQLIERSPLLLFSILSVTARHQGHPAFREWAESHAIELIRKTVFADEPPTLDDLKGILVWNAWVARPSPPGHALAMALELNLPNALENLISATSLPPLQAAAAFHQLMPSIRAWCWLYSHSIFLGLITGQRPVVSLDPNTPIRALLRFEQLGPIDARLIAQVELKTIMAVVQDNVLKALPNSLEKAVKVVEYAETHLEEWRRTWLDWTSVQEEAVGSYMHLSFSLQLKGSRFFIHLLCFDSISSAADLQPVHHTLLRATIENAASLHDVAFRQQATRITFTTVFTLTILERSALFLIKFLAIQPLAFDNVQATKTNLRALAKLLAHAPLDHHSSITKALDALDTPMLSAAMSTLQNPTLQAPPTHLSPERFDLQTGQLLDPRLDIAGSGDNDWETTIASLIGNDGFWTWDAASLATGAETD